MKSVATETYDCPVCGIDLAQSDFDEPCAGLLLSLLQHEADPSADRPRGSHPPSLKPPMLMLLLVEPDSAAGVPAIRRARARSSSEEGAARPGQMHHQALA